MNETTTPLWPSAVARLQILKYWPQLTEEEFFALDATTHDVYERRCLVSERHAQKKPWRTIAASAGITLEAVHDDLKVCHEGFGRLLSRTPREPDPAALELLAILIARLTESQASGRAAGIEDPRLEVLIRRLETTRMHLLSRELVPSTIM
jgi:hypothetical protein